MYVCFTVHIYAFHCRNCTVLLHFTTAYSLPTGRSIMYYNLKNHDGSYSCRRHRLGSYHWLGGLQPLYLQFQEI